MKKTLLITGCLIMALVVASVAMAGGNPVKLIVNGKEIACDQPPIIENGRTLVPIRAAAEALRARVDWDQDNYAVNITAALPAADGGDKYLRGLNDPAAEKPSINSNFVKAGDLLAVLDDDKDGDLCDYRPGHSGGDTIANDPLVLDLRGKAAYEAGHIPGAVWIANAENIGKSENVQALREALAKHVAAGGKNEIVAYCFTAHTAGLACGVLGTQGFNVKSLRFGYAIGWEGTQQADAPIYGPREDKDGKPVPYPEK
ncbi:MAG: stalk domain-containing protein [Bacillota bacterium]